MLVESAVVIPFSLSYELNLMHFLCNFQWLHNYISILHNYSWSYFLKISFQVFYLYSLFHIVILALFNSNISTLSTSASTGMHQPTWLMTAAWSATAGPVLDRRWTWRNWTFLWPERRSVTDRLLSMDHASGTVYRRQFATRHCYWHFPATDSSLICSFNSCSVCYSERTPHKCSN